jgi:hypothetical protein
VVEAVPPLPRCSEGCLSEEDRAAMREDVAGSAVTAMFP